MKRKKKSKSNSSDDSSAERVVSCSWFDPGQHILICIYLILFCLDPGEGEGEKEEEKEEEAKEEVWVSLQRSIYYDK